MMVLKRLFRCRWAGGVAVLLCTVVLFAAAVPLQGAGTERENGKAAQSGKDEAGKDGFLAGKHKAMGVDCEGCHKGAPGKPPPMTACLNCHGTYEQLAAKGEKLEHNPHASHLGELECGNCHQGHKASVDYCARCHTFAFKVP